MRRKSLIIFLMMFVTVSLITVNPTKAIKEEEKPCLLGSCWKELGVTQLGRMGCPTPALFIQNTLKELNSYIELANELGLTSEQLEKLEKLRHDFQIEMVRNRAELQVVTLELIEQMMKERPGKKPLQEKVSRIEELCWATLKDAAKAVFTARSLLTPEQRAKAIEIAAKEE
ncbi:hypothetical protein G4V39_10925 [Thermosulfuriphilus ammonigenes]|uniref:Uncharacterized protein n=1 Tax=Thermosulfuriphilus ammonigenes TaxID=1936021 RepID=A0A6G7PYI9_9BACT|nr:Spy/CpxP family protein refolding chaperone [Thermosulfuriphilus ammonigenes]MBA2849075.1 hypothetical protein [Thermosulfuriphilus ammonigenes]QIJ72759.1 hypothetical protein G4V39_10925 [Thermosulfuriphilus ammonigenes]